ncbi:uncharacterized protein [Cicer arietinum]|uniref:Uncharacterized protein LOC101501049 isoform X2 n=1 Tax=Cicer arietinum TaxID=3827 RepID=A0A1S2Z6V7_CICAR|nr:uncharacterized protein LOC101501049 isoform X2 [Cicer arietinum]
MTDVKEGDYYNTNTTEDDLEDKFLVYTREGDWEKVVDLYKSNVKFCTMNIDKSRGTALHVAVNDNNESVVSNLVGSILLHGNVEAFILKNEKGDTPLHLAASRGFKEICEHIIGEFGERKELVYIDNNNGETPLFLASLSWQKQTFIYLFSFVEPDYKICDGKKDYSYPYSKDLIRNNGDSILHCAIQREFFDLALIIIDKYPELGAISNKKHYTPLKLLATRPSAFESGFKMIWWKKILYHCIPVENLNVKEALELYGIKHDQSERHKYPKNYDTCYLFLHKCKEYADPLLDIIRHLPVISKLAIPISTTYASDNKVKEQKVLLGQQQQINISMPSDNEEKKQNVLSKQKQNNISIPSDPELLPENYATCLWFLKFAYINILGLSGVGVDEVRKLKQKHKWSSQLLTVFMENTSDSYFGAGNKPLRNESEIDFEAIINQNKNSNEELKSEDTKKSETLKSKEAKKSETLNNGDTNKAETLKNEKAKKAKTMKSETPILTAARYGIVEMVTVLIKKIPSSIYETNLENKNILLVAVENRRTVVVESLRKWFKECNKYPIFDNLIQEVDNEDNTVLHLAATPGDQDWNISGAALQMMWHIKWFQYTKGLVPEHFPFRTNKEDKTAGEIFEEKHKTLVKDGSEWLKDTSESCSVVAALLAGVSFATSSTVPGGNKSETGEPTLEGKPAFDAFALSSIVGLCFSVTALIMFLSILTSRKEAKDFRIDLPRKLILGLSSLFLSIVAMFTAFCSGHFFLIDQKYKSIVFLIYIVTCFPVTLYAVAQLPLYIDLLKGIITKIPMTSAKGVDL